MYIPAADKITTELETALAKPLGTRIADLRQVDPERVQWTDAEYQRANPFLRWYVRHQWGVDVFGLGGIGLIVKTFDCL